jgi:hypothetical protein
VDGVFEMMRKIALVFLLSLLPTVTFALCADAPTCTQEILDSDASLRDELQAVGVQVNVVRRDAFYLAPKTLVELQAIRQSQWDYSGS